MADADATIDRAKDEGWYDADRKVRPWDDDHLAVPVTTAPDGIEVRTDEDPVWRTRDLADVLRARGHDEAVIAAAPGSWAVIGSVILARFPVSTYERPIGEALLELHGEADTVLATEPIVGAHREPSVRVVAGAGDTETIHHEAGTAYAMDLSTVMFSPGNEHERIRMGERVSPDERVYDMFAGIGYFTLPMARAGAKVIAAERNPTAFRQLLENVMLNDVADRVDAYLTDCAALTPSVDRVVMGHFDAREYLGTAVDAVVAGGTVHVHGIGPADEPWAELERDLAAAAAAAAEDVVIEDRRIVKSHSPGLVHVVLDATVG